MNIRSIITPNCVSLNYDGITKIIERSDNRFPQIIEAIKNKAFDKIPGIVDGLKNALAISTTGSFKVENGLVYIDNTPVHGDIAERIVEYVKQGLDPVTHINFWRNLQKNPSSRARERLFKFLENGNHPFTDDGCFIAYKKVNANMKDNYTNKIDNSVGSHPSVDRSEVDDDPEHTCSRGLHVASWNYAQGYAGVVLIDVKVNPADVVAIPTDYNAQKMRTCGYEVIALSKGPRTELHVSDDAPDMDEDDLEDDEEEDYDDEVDINDPDYIQGRSDAEALLTYFKSIGKAYTYAEFKKLKRFESKSAEYKAGVEDVAEENNL